MEIGCVWEHNGMDTLLYADRLIGAFARGVSLEEAMQKMHREVAAYLRWLGEPQPEMVTLRILQEQESELAIRDADSDVLFDSEKLPLTVAEYEQLKALALRSAADFQRLYEAIPQRTVSCRPQRKTFYGAVPRTAEEMYAHTKSVNAYYFGEIDVEADNEGDIVACRARGFECLEQQPNFLENRLFDGSYGEQWTLRKVLRRFLWHDRIHAKAMYKMARDTFPETEIENVFAFDV